MLARFLISDIDPFLAMAKEEGWICGSWEFDFLLKNFPEGCLVCRELESTLGYVTAIRYGRSGWIGNLLVHPEARRRGIGRQLIEETICVLLKLGVETIWLTASEQGAGLYQKLGFVPIDHIYRWTGKGAGVQHRKSAPLDFALVREVDRGGWGDRRDTLLRLTCARGRLYSSSGGFVCCQQWENGTQIGPWGCLISSQAPQLFDQALSGSGEHVFLDVPAGNHTATALLEERGFSIKGSNLLMYLGADPSYKPGNVFALASMGSMG